MTRDWADWAELDRQRPSKVAVRPAGAGERVGAGYSPPPRTTPPPTDWRPTWVAPTVAPRDLPQQDHEAIDAAERQASRVSVAIAGVASIVLAVMFAVLCGQLLR
jgi:hypothetical protein